MQDKKQKQQCKEEFEKERDIVAWTREEDDILREQIGINGAENSAIIASKFKDKTTRQCRRRYASKFDKVDLNKIVQVVSDLPDPVLHPPVKEAFDVTYSNIYTFHAARESPEKSVENMKFLLNQIICLLW